MSHKGALATEGKIWATLTYFSLPTKNYVHLEQPIPGVLAASIKEYESACLMSLFV